MMAEDKADAVTDDYAERVLRNEGRLTGLERLVSETRESDRALTEQRSESLAQELERRADALLELVTARADAVLSLGREERDGDRSEWRLLTAEAEKRGLVSLTSFREVYDTAIRQNYEQSREAIAALESRVSTQTDKLEQMVRQWRDSDREARELFSEQLGRHLDTLNHNNERMAAFQASSVTRELWQAEKDAAIKREGLLRDQIIVLDKSMLTMTPLASSDKSHAETIVRMETAIAASARVLEAKIAVNGEKVAELKSWQSSTTVRSSAYSAFYGWAVAGVGLLITVIVFVNSFVGK